MSNYLHFRCVSGFGGAQCDINELTDKLPLILAGIALGISLILGTILTTVCCYGLCTCGGTIAVPRKPLPGIRFRPMFGYFIRRRLTVPEPLSGTRPWLDDFRSQTPFSDDPLFRASPA